MKKNMQCKRYWLSEVKTFFRATVENYSFEDFELEILRGSMDNYNRFLQAQKTLNEQGMTFTTESGQIKVNPLCNIEKCAWASFLSGIKQLKISDVETPKRVFKQPTNPGRALRAI
jgi:hypothetical protein